MGDIKTKETTIFEPELLRQALLESLKKLNPLSIWRNPVMFLVEIGSIITTISFLAGLFLNQANLLVHRSSIHMALANSDLFNLCRVACRGRGKARAESLRKTRTEVMQKGL